MSWSVRVRPPKVEGVLASLFAGLGLGLSLIVAIGAQNLFVLRQGIRREHVFAVATICALSDLALIVLGVSGIGAASRHGAMARTRFEWQQKSNSCPVRSFVTYGSHRVPRRSWQRPPSASMPYRSVSFVIVAIGRR